MGDPSRLEVLRQKFFDKGDEIATHIVEKHNGLPAIACHRCITLTATYRDLQELVAQEEQAFRQGS